MPRPNILFIFTDDQRFDTLSALGNPEIETPNLDRLVDSGTAFTHAHIMGGSHAAICIPSRAMMLTGRTLFSLEGAGKSIPEAHTTLPEHFRAHGYTTCHIGKWHQDRASHARSFSTGAKICGFGKGWYETCNGHWHIPVHDFDPDGVYDPAAAYNDPPIEPFQPPFETVKENGRHSVEVYTDAAVEFLERYPESAEGKNGDPFFLYLAHNAPHDPRQYPARLRERYRAETVALPANFAIQHPFDNGDLSIRDELLEAHPRRPDAVRQHIADYYALIAYIDEELGRVLDALEASGQAENTLVVFAGDNGLAVGQHGLMGKQNLYEHSVRVPLVFAGAGVPAGQRTGALCYLTDLFPTLCELAELPVPETVEGVSLAPALRDPETPVRETLHLAYKGVQRAVRQGDFKLIEYGVEDRHTVQLFDLRRDPLELENLAEEPAHARLRERLQRELETWRTELNDTGEMGAAFWSVARDRESERADSDDRHT
jgi:arylsulfatase A-like enzyme